MLELATIDSSLLRRNCPTDSGSRSDVDNDPDAVPETTYTSVLGLFLIGEGSLLDGGNLGGGGGIRSGGIGIGILPVPPWPNTDAEPPAKNRMVDKLITHDSFRILIVLTLSKNKFSVALAPG